VLSLSQSPLKHWNSQSPKKEGNKLSPSPSTPSPSPPHFGFLARLIDDFLYVTTSSSAAKSFIQSMEARLISQSNLNEMDFRKDSKNTAVEQIQTRQKPTLK
jgi:hypothetical protein